MDEFNILQAVFSCSQSIHQHIWGGRIAAYVNAVVALDSRNRFFCCHQFAFVIIYPRHLNLLLNYLRAEPPTQPNFNVSEEVAYEAVVNTCEWITTKPM
jgi:hypothetical protein